jgi:integrase/recombinase XerD
MRNQLAANQPSDAALVQDGHQDARLVELWLHGRSAATQRGYRAEAERFMKHVAKPLHGVTLSDLQGYSDVLDAAGLQPATRRRMLAAVKSLFSWGHRLGYLPFDTAKPLRLPPLRDTLAERVIDESALLRMIDLEPNIRNAAMLALMYTAGLRASELVALRWRDCQARSNGEGQISVLGKGSKTRTILIPASVFAGVILLRNGANDEAFVFASRKAGGPLNTSHLLRITKRAARRAGIARSVRNHDFRHSHCTHSLERGAPIHLVQQTVGHASISTTGRYLHARPNDSSSRYLPIR